MSVKDSHITHIKNKTKGKLHEGLVKVIRARLQNRAGSISPPPSQKGWGPQSLTYLP